MNAHKFLRTVPMKLYALLLALVLFSFFSNDFGLVDIQKTAIILAVGIDKAEEGFSVTTQIAVPKGADRAQGGTSSVNITTEGATVSDCITLLFGKTGWVPKLVFCDLIVLGEDAAHEDAIEYLNYFLRNEYMNDSCKLAVCEGSAEELISSQSALSDTSSMAVLNLFSDAAEKSGKVLINTLKDFAVDYYSVSESSYLPYVRMTVQHPSPQSCAGGTGGREQDENGDRTGAEMVYSADETALFLKGKMVALLGEDQTLAYALLNGNVEAGTFNAHDGEKPVTLTVLSNSGDISLDTKNIPKAKLKIDVVARLCCRGTTAPMEDVSSDEVSEEILKSAKDMLEKSTKELWHTLKECGCDLFKLKKMLYRTSPARFAEWKDFLLSGPEPEYTVEVRSTR